MSSEGVALLLKDLGESTAVSVRKPVPALKIEVEDGAVAFEHADHLIRAGEVANRVDLLAEVLEFSTFRPAQVRLLHRRKGVALTAG